MTTTKSGNEIISGEIIRQKIRAPQNPLLLIYLLEPEGAGKNPDDSDIAAWTTPVPGYAISYPKSDYFEPVTYAISKTLLPYYNNEDNTLDFDDDDE